MKRIDGRTYSSLKGNFLTVETTDFVDVGVHMWTYVNGAEQAGLVFGPRVLRELAADLIARADLLDTEFVEP